MKKIVCIINTKTGRLKVAPEGFDGPDCTEATRELERRLGMNRGGDGPKKELTPEYYTTGQSNEQNQKQ